MKLHTQIKENVKVDTIQMINFLKSKGLYISDNGVNNYVSCISGLENSIDQSLCWIGYKNYDLGTLQSSVIIVNENFLEEDYNKSLIKTKDARLAITLIINEFFYDKRRVEFISSTAIIDNTVKIGERAIINEFVVIGENCIIGDNVTIYPGVVILPNTIIGNNVVINSGAKIGQEGFGYIENNDGMYIQFPHMGKVIIGNNVEIGNNVCIDRGALSDTTIGNNTKINNLSHIAHNVIIGENCLIAAMVEISGSVKIDNDVYIGPSATIIDGITIGSNTLIGLGAIVRSNVKEKSTIMPFESMQKRELVKAMKIIKG